jgi:hypothetical protein
MTPWTTARTQVAGLVIDGKRLSVPELSELRADGGRFVGLDLYLQLMHKCWSQDPQERPSFSEIVNQLK